MIFSRLGSNHIRNKLILTPEKPLCCVHQSMVAEMIFGLFSGNGEQMPSIKRFAVGLFALPVTLPFVLFCGFMEWFHFSVSHRILGVCRRTNKRLQAFFDKL